MEAFSPLEEKVLQEGPYQNFINTIDSPKTAEIYRRHLLRYMHFYGYKSTTEMLTHETKDIEGKLANYASQKKVRRQSMNGYLSAIKKFYKANRVKIEWEWVKQFNKGDDSKHEIKGYSKEQIAKMLNYCDIRTRALVLLLASTGMRIGAIPSLRMKDLTLREEFGLYQVKVYPKDKHQYFTFTTPEARQALDAYFKDRERAGEILTPQSQVIRDKIDLNNGLKIRHPKNYTVNALSKTLYDMTVRAGIRVAEPLKEGQILGGIRHETPTAHGFKHFTITQMGNAGINERHLKKMVDHKVAENNTYYNFSPDDLLASYVKAIDALTIDPKHRLEERVKELQSIKDEEVRRLQMQVDEMQKAMMKMFRMGMAQNLIDLHSITQGESPTVEERRAIFDKFGVKEVSGIKND